MEVSLQLSVYSYGTTMVGFADQEDLRPRFDVLIKTKEPELHRYWTTRDRGANRRLFRLAGEVIHAVGAEVFPPTRDGSAKGVSVPEPVLGVSVNVADAGGCVRSREVAGTVVSQTEEDVTARESTAASTRASTRGFFRSQSDQPLCLTR